MTFHDTECQYQDQASFNNISFVVLHVNQVSFSMFQDFVDSNKFGMLLDDGDDGANNSD